MTDRKPIPDAVTEVRCDPQDSERGRDVSDTEPGEEEKCVDMETRRIPSIQELEEVLHSAPRSCRHCDEVWPNLYLGDMWVHPVPYLTSHTCVWIVIYACASGLCPTAGLGSGSWASLMCWMQHTGNCAVREVMIFMAPRWNTTESRPMTCQHLTFHLSFTLLLSSFTRLWHQEVKPHEMTWVRWHWIETPCVYPVFTFMLSRKGVCALCCRCESLSCVGPGLPHDSSPPQPSLLYSLCATETLDFSKQRLPATAHSAGPKTAGQRVEWI